MQIFTHRQGTTYCRAHGSDLRGGGVSSKRVKITVAYAFILFSRFCPSLTGLAVHERECGLSHG